MQKRKPLFKCLNFPNTILLNHPIVLFKNLIKFLKLLIYKYTFQCSSISYMVLKKKIPIRIKIHY